MKHHNIFIMERDILSDSTDEHSDDWTGDQIYDAAVAFSSGEVFESIKLASFIEGIQTCLEGMGLFPEADYGDEGRRMQMALDIALPALLNSSVLAEGKPFKETMVERLTGGFYAMVTARIAVEALKSIPLTTEEISRIKRGLLIRGREYHDHVIPLFDDLVASDHEQISAIKKASIAVLEAVAIQRGKFYILIDSWVGQRA